MGKFTWFCILALVVVALAVPAYAEVQNVKVSGDITARYIARSNLDLTKNNDIPYGATNRLGDTEDFFMSTVGVNVSADLTDNVSTTVRLVNQRDWDRTADTATSGTSVQLDLGYVTLKEMLYAPLTVSVGRQDLWYGKGLIVGSALLTGSVDPNNAISANEFSDLTAFDAVKATLDYNPLTIDLLYSKVSANGITSVADDINLFGVNAGYKFSKYNAEAEAYYFGKHNRTGEGLPAGSKYPVITVDTFGGRGSLVPIENLNIFGEVAYQSGKYNTAAAGATSRDRKAWALDLGTDYTFKKVTWEPNLAAEYILYSGQDPTVTTGDYKGWDPMYRGKFDSLIREFQGSLYGNTTDVLGSNASTSNEQQIIVSGSIKPLDSVTAKLSWDNIRAAKAYAAGASKDIGDEIDAKLTYDYTKDVQFGLLAGWFMPGKRYASPNDATATEVVGTMKVTF